MIRPNENPLTPASLATDGIQGADAKTLGPCGAKHNPAAMGAAILALTATHAASAQLDSLRDGDRLARMGSRGSGRPVERSARPAGERGHTMTAPTLKGCRCQCTACGDYFGSPVVFDRHRIGAYAKPCERKHHRRCLDPAEMEARGWIRNGGGFWIRQARQGGPAGLQAPRVTLPATCVPGAHDEAP